jgi:caa(3)-type oxidase subunit IV
MHSDHTEDVRKGVRTYWMIGAALYVFTIITVAVNQVHLAIPLAITIAVIIACIKGSMVASIFMHLSHEKRWIYGSLVLMVVLFVVLMSLPILTGRDTIGTPVTYPAAHH